MKVSEPTEWTNTFRLLSTVKDDDEVDAGEDSVVIVLHDSSEQLDSGTADVTAAESKRRRWREMPQHMRSSIDGSGQSSSVASVSGRGPHTTNFRVQLLQSPVRCRNQSSVALVVG